MASVKAVRIAMAEPSLQVQVATRVLSTFHGRILISRDCTGLPLAEQKYGGSQLDWFFQKDQVARIEFKGLRVRNQIFRVRWRYDLIMLCSNQQRRGLDSRGVISKALVRILSMVGV
jgi:hypothetical protein